MSSYKIGVNLRVTENSNQGGRKYMEDTHAIRFVKNDEGGFEFAYFGIFDGHGGGEASKFAREHLLDEITKYECFWNDNDEDVLHAIKSGFLDVHFAMWREVDRWPKTSSGFRSTSGTTASIAIIKNSKLYIGHVGDSGIALGYDDSGSEKFIRPKGTMLTIDHKPDSPEEKKRIEECGGQVVAKSGVQRVVWNRPRNQHQGPIRRSTPIDRIPFLAVARSLGDLWSYNYLNEQFVVSPEPDVSVRKLDPARDKCLVLGSDGMWNMVSAEESVSVVVDLEYHFEYKVINDPTAPVSYWINPAEKLVQRALNKWKSRLMRADNTSCVVVLIDPLGPRKLSLLKKEREENLRRIRESKEKQTIPVKMSTRSSPRKPLESDSDSGKNDVKKTSPKSAPSSPRNDNVHKGVVSPVSTEKTRRMSVPNSMEFDLDDSIQAASINKKLNFTPSTVREKMSRAVDISDQILAQGSASAMKKASEMLTHGHRGIMARKIDDQLCPESASAMKKANRTNSKHTDLQFNNNAVVDNSHFTRTRQRHSSDAVLTLKTPHQTNPLTLLKGVVGKSLTENKTESQCRNVLTENSKQSNKVNSHDQHKAKGKIDIHSKEDQSICDGAAFKLRTKEEINERLGHGHQLRNSSKKGVVSKPSSTALRRLSSDSIKNTTRTSMRLRKINPRSLRCKSQTENKNFVSKFKLGGLKRKRTFSEGAPVSKKVCRS
ncbi:uncharacterized protein [Mytilus edulis]